MLLLPSSSYREIGRQGLRHARESLTNATPPVTVDTSDFGARNNKYGKG
jgi:hypothetical protein